MGEMAIEAIAMILGLAFPATIIITIIKLYSKTKKQETEIAILKERLKNYERENKK